VYSSRQPSAADLRLMQQVAVRSWRVEKPLSYMHVGDLAWQCHRHGGREHEWRMRLWLRDGEPVGWGWLWTPGDGELQVAQEDRSALVVEVAEWLAGEAAACGAAELVVSALESDRATLAALASVGFDADAEPPYGHMVRSLGDLPEQPSLPDGFRVRHVSGEADLPRRVAVHRAAFSVLRPSRVTEQSYRNVMAAWPYRPELDWVVEAPGGRFTAACLIWLDEANGVGELEPVGTDPAFWRMGHGRAVCLAALRALAQHGADTAMVAAREAEGLPPAPALYRSIGFRTAARVAVLRRSIQRRAC
jgi:ribosomal protein S18 acetylase RimI-like enzyme